MPTILKNTFSPQSWEVVHSDGFEAGFGNWNQGGGRCTVSSEGSYASRGDHSIRLSGNTETPCLLSDSLHLSSFKQVKVSFSYQESLGNGEMSLRLSNDGGGAYTTIKDWYANDDLNQPINHDVEIMIDGPFTNDTVFAFYSGSTSNDNAVYIDDVVISVASVDIEPVQVTGSDSGSKEIVVKAINAGGKAYTATDGTLYLSDQDYISGDPWVSSSVVDGTKDSSLYQSQRFSQSSFSYTIPITNGEYKVILQWADIYSATSGSSVFGVEVEANSVTEGFDVIGQAGQGGTS